MILSLEQLQDRVRDFGECTIYFYDRKPEPGEKLKDVNKFNVLVKNNATEQIEKIAKFAKEFPHTFFVHITKSGVANPNQGFKVLCDLGMTEAEMLQGAETRIYQNPEQIEKRLREAILKEFEEKERAKRLEEREREVEEEKKRLLTVGGKMGILLEQFIGGILAANMNKTQNNNETMNGEINNKEVNQDELVKALNYLTECLGPDGIIKLAKKVKEQPTLINMVKNFIG